MFDWTKILKPDQPKNLLVVEGPEDLNVFAHLLKSHGYEGQVYIHSAGGVEELLKAIPVYVKVRTPDKFGIVLDADESVSARWDAVRHAMTAAGYASIPVSPARRGTLISEPNLPLAGIWLMPTNEDPGTLEDFIGFLVPEGDILWPLAERVMEEVVQINRRFAKIDGMKALLHTWLAWQQEPGTPLGLAITRRYLDPHCAQANEVMDWLRQVFALPPKGVGQADASDHPSKPNRPASKRKPRPQNP